MRLSGKKVRKILKFPEKKRLNFRGGKQIQEVIFLLRIAFSKFELALVFSAVLRSSLLKKDKSSIRKT